MLGQILESLTFSTGFSTWLVELVEPFTSEAEEKKDKETVTGVRQETEERHSAQKGSEEVISKNGGIGTTIFTSGHTRYCSKKNLTDCTAKIQLKLLTGRP